MQKKIGQCLISEIFLFVALVIGLMAHPQLQAYQEYFGSTNYVYDCSEEPIPCPPPHKRSIFDSKTACVIGSAIIGAGIGAGVALAVQNERGHKGSEGVEGATGPAGEFPSDTGESLTVNFTLGLMDLVAEGVLVPFVTGPDGVTVEGPAINYAPNSMPVIAPIVISDPAFGFYNIGLQFTGANLAGTYFIMAMVVASRDGATTFIQYGSQTISMIGVTETQFNNTFTYDPDNVP